MKMVKYNENKIFELLKSKNEKAVIKYMIKFIPNTLSKFYSFTDDEKLNESKISAFLDNWSWFDYANNQNDELEFKMIDNVDEQVPVNTINAVSKQMFDEIRKKLLLCCFSSNDYKNKKMWNEYANNYNGYYINYGINRKEIFTQVHYQDNQLFFTGLFIPFIISCDKFEYSKIETERKHYEEINNKLVDFYKLLYSLKETKWQEENEYRIISSPFSGYDNRVSNVFLGLKSKYIVIGYNCNENNKNRLIEISKKKNIKCYQLIKNGEELSKMLIY